MVFNNNCESKDTLSEFQSRVAIVNCTIQFFFGYYYSLQYNIIYLDLNLWEICFVIHIIFTHLDITDKYFTLQVAYQYNILCNRHIIITIYKYDKSTVYYGIVYAVT